MSDHGQLLPLPGVLGRKPLQAGKFVGILLALVLGVAGFFRVVDTRALLDSRLLGDGQFLALVLLPLVSLGLVAVVFLETLASGYRALRSENSIGAQAAGRWGYLVLRGAEAAVAVVGVTVMFAALPVLFAESTPGPAGVGVMLLLMVVGVGILCASLVRSAAELLVYGAN